MIITLIYGITYTTIRVIFANQNYFTTVETAIYIPTFTTKLILDGYVAVIFIVNLKFFLDKKRSSLKKEAL